MSLIVEDGTGIQGAESYATVAYVTAYWAARTNDSNATIWAALNDDGKKEGSLRAATSYLDATWGVMYKGKRRGWVQGLLWPRSGALDNDGYELPALPDELKRAVAELAVRASAGPLAPDVAHGDAVKSESKKVGPLEVSTTYVDGASTKVRYGIVEGLIASLLTISPGSAGSWDWG
jgi:hypothetical protein